MDFNNIFEYTGMGRDKAYIFNIYILKSSQAKQTSYCLGQSFL